jgi:4-amino-4-deoxy-L-arabinose transferase-like glycosyltransferase
MQINRGSLKLWILAWVSSIIFSFVLRFPGLYDTSYQWRPLQTEMTAYWFAREGLDIINYQTPLYGPPWQIPFEFPLFQAAAAIISRLELGSFDLACRLTALLFFYLAALFLYLLCRKIFPDSLTNFVILSLYLLLPYNIHYSTEPLIDYLALALALAYLYFILRWLDNRSLGNALFATIGGSLGVLVKPTTMPIVLPPIIVFVFRDILTTYGKDLKQLLDWRHVVDKVWTQRLYWLTLVMMAVIPALVGSVWTHHTDSIKENSVFTQWLTSKALVKWNFGTWALRKDPNIWMNYISIAIRHLLPYGLSVFATWGIFTAIDITGFPKERAKIGVFIISVIAGVAAVLAIFLNLYRHEYYYIALSASLAILGGYGLARFCQFSRNKHPAYTIVLIIWAVIFLTLNAKDYRMLRNDAISNNQRWEEANAKAQEVQKYVPSDNWVVVVEYDWNPSYIYPLERKAMVVTPQELDKPICQVLGDKRFTLVVVPDLDYHQNEILLDHAFQCFESQKEIMPGVFVVTH